MELINLDLNNIEIPKNIVACIGVFDGVHIGHQKLIDSVVKKGDELNLKKAIITFDPHPDFVLKKNGNEKYLTPLSEKIKIVEKKYNIDYFIVIKFDEKLSRLSYIEFYNLFLKNINYIIVGYDFRFGYLGEGNINKLQKLHNNCVVVEKVSYDLSCEKVSSKLIVKLLSEGNICLITKLFNNRFYKISGQVSHGSHIGTKIGFPTANIDVSNKYYYMKNGVYAVRINLKNKYFLGIANYGCNPSFNKIDKPRLEVNIFNFNDDIYDEIIEVEFMEFIREEICFNNVNEFVNQLKKDIEYCNNKYGGCYENINRWGDGQ